MPVQMGYKPPVEFSADTKTKWCWRNGNIMYLDNCREEDSYGLRGNLGSNARHLYESHTRCWHLQELIIFPSLQVQNEGWDGDWDMNSTNDEATL